MKSKISAHSVFVFLAILLSLVLLGPMIGANALNPPGDEPKTPRDSLAMPRERGAGRLQQSPSVAIEGTSITDPVGDTAFKKLQSSAQAAVAGKNIEVRVPTWVLGDPASFSWYADTYDRPSRSYLDYAPDYDAGWVKWKKGQASSIDDVLDSGLQPYQDLIWAGIRQADPKHLEMAAELRGTVSSGPIDTTIYHFVADNGWFVAVHNVAWGTPWLLQPWGDNELPLKPTAYEDITLTSVDITSSTAIDLSTQLKQAIPAHPPSSNGDPAFGWFIDSDNDPATGIAGHGADLYAGVEYDRAQGEWIGVLYILGGNKANANKARQSISFKIAGNEARVMLEDLEPPLSSPFRWYAFVDVEIGRNDEWFFDRVDEAPDSEWMESNIPEPEMEVRYTANNELVADGDSSPSASKGTDFGSVDVAEGNVVRSFAVYNTGTANLELSGDPRVQVSGCSGFSIVTQPGSPVLPSTSESFSVEFNPSESGACDVTLSIVNNDDDENPYNFALHGSGEVESSVTYLYLPLVIEP